MIEIFKVSPGPGYEAFWFYPKTQRASTCFPHGSPVFSYCWIKGEIIGLLISKTKLYKTGSEEVCYGRWKGKLIYSKYKPSELIL